MGNSTLKSVAAILAGLFANAAVTIGTDMFMSNVGIFPPFGIGFYTTSLVLLGLSYRTLFAVLGGYISARVAPSNPMLHVKWLITVGAIIGILSAIGGWNGFPHWYLVAIVLCSIVATWIGGRLGAQHYSFAHS
jgi:hypothetical protein